MPVDPTQILTLGGILALTEAWLLDQEKPATPVQEAIEGLTDANLYDQMAADGDVLAGMTFDEAVARDPRRIEALVDQRVTNDFYRALSYLREGVTADLMRQAYLHRNRQLRAEHGPITAVSLCAHRTDIWENHYQKVLEVAVKMRRPGVPAETFWQAVTDNAATLRRAFRESHEIANRASFAAVSQEESDAWAQIGVLITNMYQTLENHIIALALAPSVGAPAPLQPTPVGGELTEGGEMRALPVAEEDAEEVEGEDMGEDEAPGAGAPEEEPEEFGLFRGRRPRSGGGLFRGFLPLESFGADWFDGLLSSGHRAPGTDPDSWVRGGGRWY